MNKLNTILLLFSLSVQMLIAQIDIEATVKTPQVADMIRYGNVPISQYAGRLDLQIPLTTIEDVDFSFPISLNYNSSGFMPMKNDGLTGMNWSLACAGSIVREVKGFPDDMPIYDSPNYVYAEYGFMYFLKNKNRYDHNAVVLNPQKYVLKEISPIPVPRFYDANNPGTSGRNYVEPSSDIYHFNFGKHAGKFMINFDGSVNVISKDEHVYDVDLSRYTYADFTGGTSASTITITTDDGYKYVFGGTYDAVEFSLQWQNHFPPHPSSNSGWDGFRKMFEKPGFYITISSFSLSKIVAPSGRTLEINYKKLPSDFYNKTSMKMYNALSGESAKNYRQFFQTTYTHSYHRSYASHDPAYQPSEVYAINHILTKQPLIESIQTDEQKIQFYYANSDRNPVSELQELRADHVFPIENVAGAKLTRIAHSVKYKKENYYNIHRTINLTYQKWTGDTNRELLASVNCNDRGKYLLTYDTSRTAPSLLTFNIDHWNYWKPYSNLSRLHLTSGGNRLVWDDIEYNVSGERDADVSGASLGMLTQIVYPAGGKSVFTYERHDYSKEVIRNKASSFFPKLMEWSQNAIAGGCRIKSITEYDNIMSNPVAIRRYYYRHHIDVSKSSGILNNKPTYFRGTHYVNSGIWGDQNYIYVPDQVYVDASNVGFTSAPYENDHVSYSTVIETQSDHDFIIRKKNYSLFYYEKRKEWVFKLPTTEAEFQTQTHVGTGETSCMHIVDSRGNTVKKIVYTEKDNLIKFYYTAVDLGLRPNNEYKVILEAGERSRIELNLSYEESQSNATKKSMLVTTFTSYTDSPDNFDNLSIYGAAAGQSLPMSVYLNMDLNDRSSRRGNIKEQSYYNEKGQLLKSTSYSYIAYTEGQNGKVPVYFKKTTPLVGRLVSYSTSAIPNFTTRFGQAYIPLYQMVRVNDGTSKLRSVTTTEYLYKDNSPVNALTTRVDYQYADNAYRYKRSESWQDSQGQTRTINYKYACEMESDVYRGLAQKHILSPVVEIEQKVDGETVSLMKNQYAFKNRLVIESIEEGRNRSLLRPVYTVKSFTAYGNPARVVFNRGKEILYLWDKYYLVGKVENPGKYLFGSYSGGTLDEVRKMVPEACITTFDHHTPFQLSSITDIRGVPIFYDYNPGNGFLEKVYSTIGGNKYLYNEYKINLLQQ